MKRIIGTCSIVLLGLLMVGACQPSPGPLSILDKAIAAHGSKEKMLKRRAGVIRAMESRGKNGDETNIEETFDLPKRWKRVVTILENGKKNTITRLTIDGQVWMWENEGTIVKSKDDGTVHPIIQKGLALVELKSEKFKLSPVDKTKVNGEFVSGFKASCEGLSADYFFDGKSGLFTQSVYKVLPKPDEELDAKYVASDYKEADGVKIAHRTRTYYKGGQFEQFTLITDFRIIEVKILDKVLDDVFRIPTHIEKTKP